MLDSSQSKRFRLRLRDGALALLSALGPDLSLQILQGLVQLAVGRFLGRLGLFFRLFLARLAVNLDDAAPFTLPRYPDSLLVPDALLESFIGTHAPFGAALLPGH